MPGKPTDNPYIESFNGSFRDESLNAHCFFHWATPGEKLKSRGKNITPSDSTAVWRI
ncbi:integrase core domain-containing protein [Sphingobacterium siyangense]|uniref:integrase core domain-containing protein n=1 Tax=Sphingobacterium siyangense TaxID=459529 RepID=UPI0039648B23